MENFIIEHLNCTKKIAELPQKELHQAQLTEAAIAISINGISQAVMMASPEHLKDFALGFSLSEGLIHSVNEVLDIIVHSHVSGWQVDIMVLARVQHRLKQRRRTMAGPSGCGLCGLDSIEAAMSLHQPHQNEVKSFQLPSEKIIIQARDALPSILKKSGSVRGNHCAAFFDLSAKMIAFREDVGRHSALDKLLGCLSHKKLLTHDGFALITSRCSHDLIAKAARLYLTTLVTLAQPTDLAVNSARKSQIALFCFQHGQLKRYA
ncbi:MULTISPECIES: formate dehydrogenase accessory sulfurtransferase FdhD [unclassified Colwellia]|uniref:formate dehydrogenase accessory sulfurtransferase FdhD n=1 Tax=unclassified Colwellia TaxID=196834 RepID=UPI0015F461DC|nr:MULTISPECIES: formate dehydrogenase accessory sulfurtransferase FdhD [unclassified Colwellia]MBA6251007.1 formate dehydrogenase accessory sulfurtransferase FdhD [Colwellia sp. MB3u-55]MBA6399432.1 formate dehydrogenase accessory sulfurtransferase FdhD [Colwellia sp. BRX10-4]